MKLYMFHHFVLIHPSNSFQTLVGHGGHVMSIDFHPTKVGLLSSCDSNDEIRLWDVNTGDRKLDFKGGGRQVRFQPQLGDVLATSTGNVIISLMLRPTASK